MAFNISHSQLPQDAIYYLKSGGLVYIGQSFDIPKRIYSHIHNGLTSPFSGTQDGSELIYAAMRENGLQYSEIDFYSAENNYGLTQEDFDL